MRGFPPTPTLMPNTTTTCLTATSKMNPLAPKGKMKNLSKANETRNGDWRTRQTKMLSPILRRWPRRVRLKITTSQPHLPLNVPNFNDANHRPDDILTRTGNVAIIRDMGAVTCVWYGFSQQILQSYRSAADLRQCCISYTLAKYSLPRSVPILVTISLCKQGPEIGGWGNYHLHQRNRFIVLRTR